jgi:hypothetical protein
VRRSIDSNGCSSSFEDISLRLRANSLRTAMNGAGCVPAKDDEKESSGTSVAPDLGRTEGIKSTFMSLLNSFVKYTAQTRRPTTILQEQFGGVSGSSGQRWMTAPLPSAL